MKYLNETNTISLEVQKFFEILKFNNLYKCLHFFPDKNLYIRSSSK